MNTNSQHPLPQTISEYIYRSLREAILNNELQANQRINEKELTVRFHVSRTPIREAILRLSAEGFVHIDSYKRAVVKSLSFEELREILQVLGALDRLAISLAIDKMGPKEIEVLDQITAKMKKHSQLKSFEKYIELNAIFHNTLWKSVPNRFLREILSIVKDKRDRYLYSRIAAYKDPLFLKKSQRHHVDLMEAIRTKNKEAAMNLIVEHRNIFLEYPESFHLFSSPADPDYNKISNSA